MSRYFIMLRDPCDIGHRRFAAPCAEDDRTAILIDRYTPIASEGPLRFTDIDIEAREARGLPPVMLADVLIGGAACLVREPLAEALLDIDAPGLQLVPAVLRTRRDAAPAPFWHLHFYQLRDVWDRGASEFLTPWDPSRDLPAGLKRIVLDSERMAGLPPGADAIFMLDNVLGAPMVLREDLASRFKKLGVRGARLFDLAVYESGIEYR